VTASVALGALLMAAFGGAMVVGAAGVIRRGPDVPHSHRLDAAGAVCLGVLLIIAPPASLFGLPVALALAMAVLVFLGFGLWVAGRIVAARERSDAERLRREIGLPPTPRMWTWWAVLAVYLVGALAVMILGAYVVQWTHPSLTRAELDQVVAGLLASGATLVLGGCGHAAYQWFRLRRRDRHVA